MVDLTIPQLEPQLVLPPDENLPGFAQLFDTSWVWENYCANFGRPEEAPERLRMAQLSYRPGRRAVVAYVVRYAKDAVRLDDRFVVELSLDQPLQSFLYPNDPVLPGLPQAVSAIDATELTTKYTRFHPRSMRVEVIRYRAFSHAVLRYVDRRRLQGIGKGSLFVRVMRTADLPPFFEAARVGESAGFVLPRLAGSWPEGGMLWIVRVPGENVRGLVRSGNGPDPNLLLDPMARLWSLPMPEAVASRDILGGYRMVRDLMAHLLEGRESLERLNTVSLALRPFVDGWKPTAMAHNDYYDDQMLITNDTGRVAMVDFEEIGPGDPMMDVGNLLAHQKRSARLNKKEEVAAAVLAYRKAFRSAALERFGWDHHELNLREAYCLFRLAPNAFHQLREDWRDTLETGLAVCAEALEQKR